MTTLPSSSQACAGIQAREPQQGNDMLEHREGSLVSKANYYVLHYMYMFPAHPMSSSSTTLQPDHHRTTT